MSLLCFSELEKPGLAHGFTLRTNPAITSANLPEILSEAGLPENWVMAEQTHGNGVAVVGKSDAGKTVPVADALITREKDVSLVIRVADCAPVWLYCGKTEVIGLVHSGKKGTAAGVVPAIIRSMKEEFGCDPNEMTALLGPCIRPPHYEVDFASEILRQLKEGQVGKIVDTLLCTASEPERFFSYRREKGKTGRHFAIFSLSGGRS